MRLLLLILCFGHLFGETEMYFLNHPTNYRRVQHEVTKFLGPSSPSVPTEKTIVYSSIVSNCVTVSYIETKTQITNYVTLVKYNENLKPVENITINLKNEILRQSKTYYDNFGYVTNVVFQDLIPENSYYGSNFFRPGTTMTFLENKYESGKIIFSDMYVGSKKDSLLARTFYVNGKVDSIRRYLSDNVFFVERFNSKEEKVKFETPDKNSFTLFTRSYNDKGDVLLMRRLEVFKNKTNETEIDRYEYDYQ